MSTNPVNDSLGIMLENEIGNCKREIEKATINIAKNEVVLDLWRDREFMLKEMYKQYRVEKDEQED